MMKKLQLKKRIAWLLIISMLFCGQTVPVKTEAKKAVSKPVITKVTATNNGDIKIRYKKTAKDMKCKIQVSTDKKFKKNVRTKTVRGTAKTVTLKKFQGGTYYVRMRTIRTKKKKKQYSAWSAVKKIKVSKAKKATTKKSTTAQPKVTKTPSAGMTDEDWIREWWDEIYRPTSSPRPTPSSTTDNGKDNTDTDNPSDGKDNTDTDNPSGDKKDPVSVEDGIIYLYGSDNIRYTGEEKCPEVDIYLKGSYLVKDKDYTVSYENNVNVGTATIHIQGIGDYYGEITRTFEIQKNVQNCNPSFSESEAIVGKALPIVFTRQPEGKITYTIRDVKNSKYVEDLQVAENGDVALSHSGIYRVYMDIEASDNYYSGQYDLGEIAVCDEDDPVGGFAASVYSGEGTAKTTVQGPVVENGIGSFSISYTSDTSDAWLDEHIRFEVDDATPTAYTKAFQWLGADMTAPSVKVQNSSEELRSGYEYNTISGPCVDQVATYTNKYSVSARKLTITAGIGVRVCKVKAYRDNVLYDVVYVATRPKDQDGNDLDEELYATARHKVEDKLWTDDMSNLQKLCVLADYISATTHYPGKGCTWKEKNPTFWNAFAVDGIDLFYNWYSMTTLNRIMDLQGGITTCVAVTIIQDAATDDLGLPYLYDPTTKTIADGEGVWQATGSYSSNPSQGHHVSVIYKDANEKRSFIDAQGLMTDTPCESHGCLSKVIRD